MPTPTLKDAATGCLVGLAVGDALGYPHEFRRVSQVRREIGPDGITDFLSLQDPRFTRPVMVGRHKPPGTYTDDTQMALAVAEGLIEAGRPVIAAPIPVVPDIVKALLAGEDVPTGEQEPVKDPPHDALMEAIGRHFIAWHNSPDNDRSPGETCGIGCQNLDKGVPWREAGVEQSKGCGSVMRVAPVGLFFDDLDRCALVGMDSSRHTHGHPAALVSCAGMAVAVRLARLGLDPAAIHAEVAARCSGNPDFDAVWARLPRVLFRPPAEVLVDLNHGPHALGEGWVAEEAFASAMYCFWRHCDDYRQGVLLAANTDGDSDSIACMAGALLGARLGASAIPTAWREGVENSALLHETAARLVQARGT
jgi:ADP-ribosylglycohydrolase